MTAVTVPMLAALHYERGVDVSAVLVEVIDRLRNLGITVGGLLQEPEVAGPESCAMLRIVDLRSSERARIMESRGKDARGCKLDEQRLVAMSHCIDEAIRDRVDLIIISRFGRAESAGSGLLACFTDAVCAGIPLLTAVRKPYTERWCEFHGGLAVDLQPSSDAVLDWFGSKVRTAKALRREFAHPELSG